MPFNIIPSVKSFLHLFSRLLRLGKRKKPSANDDPAEPSNFNGPKGSDHVQVSMISNGHTTNNIARRKSYDVNQTLTYRKVMERVKKRFLLHKQREEQDEIREGDFEELKQDIQMLRFEMINRLDETRDDLAKNSRLLNEGVLVVGELLTSLNRNENSILRDNFQEFKRNFHLNLDKFRSIDSGMDSSESATIQRTITTSESNLSSMTNTSSSTANIGETLIKSSSEPNLSENRPDLNPIQVLKHLSAAQITLSNIVEENEENEIEVDARHISVQTTPNHDEPNPSVKI